MPISTLIEQKIALLGFGREAQATVKFLRANNYSRPIFVLSDEENIQAQVESDEIISIKANDLVKFKINLVIRSPGFSPFHPLRQFLDTNKIQQTTATRIALKLLRDQQIKVIGITASKGKSTTSTLTQLMLANSAINSLLVGNIGIPILTQIEKILTEKPVVVMELSSYQCADLEENFAPSVAYIGALFPEHLDYHGNLNNYYQAKFQIGLNQREDDTLFVHYPSHAMLPATKSQRILVNQPFGAKRNGFYFELGKFYQGGKFLFSDENMLLPGLHNRENVCAALALSTFCGANPQNSLQTINSFAGLPYRLEYEGEWQQIKWYNDSISTAPEATVAALNALSGKVHTLIVGGQDRGYDVTPLITSINQLAIAQVIVLPETGNKIALALDQSKFAGSLISCDDLTSAVEQAKNSMPKNSCCLFSPGAPSYHAFSDFIARGEMFRAAVRDDN